MIPLELEDSFNTVNSVMIFTQEKTTEEKESQLWEETNNILVELDRLFNIQTRANDTYVTELMKINNAAGDKPVAVSDEVIFVIEKGIEMSQKTTVDDVALFDITIAPVWKLWDFVNKIYDPFEGNWETIPADDKIREVLPLVDYRKIEINHENHTVFLKEKGMMIDLGAIVKGYAADKVKQYLVSKGYTKAVIDIGRNIQTIGTHFDKEGNDKPWSVKLQTPFIEFYESEDMQYFGRLKVNDSTVVTSGTYEKYIKTEEGKMYHHILDPRTGYPFDNGVVSITVVTKDSVMGDCYSTSLFSLGLESGMALAQADGLETVWVVDNNGKNEVYISAGLEGNFEFNEAVISKGYVYKGVYR
jgi:thiamine biosynthesis lipoprotein